MPDLEPPFRGQQDFLDLTDMLAALGFNLPYDRMRQSHNVEEAIPGTSSPTRPVSRRVFGYIPPDNPMAVAAGIQDVESPFIGLPERRVEYIKRK